MEKKTDLRIVKTKRRIKEVFADLLKKKSLKDISVSELARIAEINKGTFYLHYEDIYALYNEMLEDKVNEIVDGIDFYDTFFTAPEEFVRHFFDLRKNHIRPDQDPVFRPENFMTARMVVVPQLMTAALRNKLYAQGRIGQSEENDIKLDYILFSMFHFLRMNNPVEEYPIVSMLIVTEIRTAFPNINQ